MIELTIKAESAQELKTDIANLMYALTGAQETVEVVKTEAAPKVKTPPTPPTQDIMDVAPKPSKDETAAGDEPVPLDKAQELVAKHIRANGADSLKAALSEAGYPKLSRVPEEKRNDVLRAMGVI